MSAQCEAEKLRQIGLALLGQIKTPTRRENLTRKQREREKMASRKGGDIARQRCVFVNQRLCRSARGMEKDKGCKPDAYSTSRKNEKWKRATIKTENNKFVRFSILFPL